jgi:hypothetical protein
MTTNATGKRCRAVRVAVLVLLVSGSGVLPALGASVSVTSNKLTTLRSCVLTGSTSLTTVVVDTFVNQGSLNQNNGSTTSMTVNSASGSKNTRSYVRFDLTRCTPAMASSARIASATLRLYVTAVPNACRTQDVFRVTASWGETTITWNNQPFGTLSNNPPSSQATSSMNVGSAPCTNSSTNVYVTGWNVTSDVTAFVAGSATNNGWMIRDDVEDSSTARNSIYRTNEQNNADKGPQLIIDYTS